MTTHLTIIKYRFKHLRFIKNIYIDNLIDLLRKNATFFKYIVRSIYSILTLCVNDFSVFITMKRKSRQNFPKSKGHKKCLLAN